MKAIKKVTILFLIFLLTGLIVFFRFTLPSSVLALPSKPAPPPVEWTKTYGGTGSQGASSVQQTSDGGYILAGDKLSFSSGWDTWVVKTDQNGNMIWSKTFGEPNAGDWICSVRATSDGGYIMAGCYNRMDPDLHPGDFWLIKTDSAGSVQWSRQYGDFFNRYESANSALQTTDGGFIAVGSSGLTSASATEIWLIKTDSSGEMIWNKTLAGSGSAVIQTNDRGYVIAGSSPWVSTEDGSDFLLVKLIRANPPVASYSYEPANPLVQQGIVFNASSSYDLDNDINSYKWDFKDGNITTISNPVLSHSFTTPGIYNVTLTVTDSEELTSSYAQAISAKINTSISISKSSETTYANFPVTFSGTLSDSQRKGIRNATVSI